MKPKEKPKYSIMQNVWFMVKTAWHTRARVLFVCLLMAALNVGGKLTQLFIAPEILARVEENALLSELLMTIGIFSGLSFLLTFGETYFRHFAQPARIDVRMEIIRKINRKASTTSYPNSRDPEILKLLEQANAATEGNNEASENIWTTLTDLMTNVAGFVIYLALLSNMDPFLLCVVIATTAVGFFVTRYINEWEYRHRAEKDQYIKEMGYIRKKTESIELAKDIRIFGLADWLMEVYNKSRRLYEGFMLRKEKALLWGNAVDVALAFARNGIAYAYLIRKALAEGLPASEFLLYFTAVSGFTAWVTGILEQCSTLHKESIALSRVQEYINLPEPFRFEDGADTPEADGYELQLENVTFRYPGAEKTILENVNLTIRPGEKLAIVGLNGAGKTTLVRLLCGFYDPDEGRVLLNGQDIREFNRKKYYDLFSAVFQEFFMLDVTVAETVAQSVENINLDRVADCIEKAGMTEQISKFPKGLQTHIGRKVYLDGVMLSGGQTQRLMLARALYKDGPILVLDEPTAALDPIAENDIYMKYNEMTKNKTSVFISHRLASTRFCDRIIFVANWGHRRGGNPRGAVEKRRRVCRAL